MKIKSNNPEGLASPEAATCNPVTANVINFTANVAFPTNQIRCWFFRGSWYMVLNENGNWHYIALNTLGVNEAIKVSINGNDTNYEKTTLPASGFIPIACDLTSNAGSIYFESSIIIIGTGDVRINGQNVTDRIFKIELDTTCPSMYVKKDGGNLFIYIKPASLKEHNCVTI